MIRLVNLIPLVVYTSTVRTPSIGLGVFAMRIAKKDGKCYDKGNKGFGLEEGIMGRNILFINKFPEIVQEFLDAMRDKEVTIDTAQNGIDAAALLKKKEYEVVVTGLSMTGYNGEQIVTYLNKNCPNTVCIIYTTIISMAQLQFFMNKRDVFRVFLRPINFRQEFFEALEEAFEYHMIRVRETEEANERMAELERYRRETAELERKLNDQRAERDDMAKYMKNLMDYSMKEYTGRLAPDGKQKLRALEGEVVDMCCGQDGELRANLPKAEKAVERIHELLQV